MDLIKLFDSYGLGKLSEVESFHLGVCILFDVNFEPREGAEILSRLINGEFRRDVGIWLGYAFAMFQATDNAYVEALEEFPKCAYSRYVLGLIYKSKSQPALALRELEASVRLEPFPNNLRELALLKAKSDTATAREMFLRSLELVVDARGEEANSPSTLDDAYQRYCWEGHLLGRQVSSVLFERYQEEFDSLIRP